jgi:hypothetical protein
VIEKISKLFKQSKPTNLMTLEKLNKNHLEEKLSIDDIEAREFVYDPLNAVPHLPFGFHNSSWLKFKFKFKLIEGDELWSFSAILNNEYGHPHKKRGYAILRGSKIQSCFYTVDYRLSKQYLITIQNNAEEISV